MSALSKATARRALQSAAVLAISATLAQAAWAQSAPAAYTTGHRYDLAGREVGTIAPDPDGASSILYAAVRNTYNNSGYLITVQKGELASWQAETISPASWAGFTIFQTVEFTYDSLGRKLTELAKGSDGVAVSLTQYSYDSIGRLDCTVVRMNPATFASPPASACTLGTAGSQGPDRVTKNIYDAAGHVMQIRKAVGTASPNLEQAYATYSYTPNGKQEYVIDANGNRAKLEYDGFDRQVKWIFPAQTLPSGFNPSTPATALSTAGSLNTADYEQYGYDAGGNRTSLRKRDTTTLTYAYDNLNRMSVKTVPERSNLNATHTRDVYYSYNARGLMIGANFDSTSGEGISTAYDGFRRVTSSTVMMNGVSRALSYLYDNDGDRTRVTSPDGGYASYAYDGLDRPQTVSASDGGWSKTYAYNQRGELVSDTLSGSAGTTSFTRDNIGRLSSLARDLASTTSDITTSFTYNPANQTVQEARTNDAYAFGSRVNVNRPYVPNGLNQYASVSTVGYCYDANGNLTADGTYVYLYDVENRLVEKRTKANGNCPSLASDYTGTLQASLRYDPMGRLYEMVGVASDTTRFLIDGDAMVAEYDAASTLLRRYLHGADGKADDPIVWYEGAGMTSSNRRFLFADRQGSITLAGDAAGIAVRLFRFDEYGIPEAGDGAALAPANGARFLYSGQAWLRDLGMYYYKARIYAPMLGRFMQTDPIGYADQNNLYTYVGNDPVNGSDPTGLCPNGQPSCWEASPTGADLERTLHGNGNSSAGSGQASNNLAFGKTSPQIFGSSQKSGGCGGGASSEIVVCATNSGRQFQSGVMHFPFSPVFGADSGWFSRLDSAQLSDNLETFVEAAYAGMIHSDKIGEPAREAGLPGGKNDYYQRYIVFTVPSKVPGLFNGPRLYIGTNGLIFLAPYHKNPGPGVPSGFIQIAPFMK